MGRGESILIVDDVKGQRNLAAGVLTTLNCNVASVSSGEGAVAYLKEHQVDLMVLDMIMDPGMDGLFRDCFPRRETWESFLLCLRDRLQDPERISPDATDATLPEGTGARRSRQRFLSDAVWDAEKVLARYHEEVWDALGDRNGALVF